MKKLSSRVFGILLLAAVLLASVSFADEGIMPRADTEFSAATVYLSPNKTVSFSALTYDYKDEIKITTCTLQQKIDGIWHFVRFLTPPPEVTTDDNTYGGYANYSSVIGAGTFRVTATFNADGHAITRSSLERTFTN